MIAIDTNVLLCHLLNDDKAQARKAHAVMRSSEAVLITDIVLAETAWTLAGKKYKAGRDDIVRAIDSLFGEPHVVFENPQVVWAALNDYRRAKPVRISGRNRVADFPDALIINEARYMATQAGDVLNAVYAFDRAALEIDGAVAP